MMPSAWRAPNARHESSHVSASADPHYFGELLLFLIRGFRELERPVIAPFTGVRAAAPAKR
jgi:hypothetical protein